MRVERARGIVFRDDLATTEAVRQLRGTSTAQVPGCEIVLGGGPARATLSPVDGLEPSPLKRFVEVRGAVDDDLTGDAPGQWRPLWLVVGEEEYGLNALLVDLDNPRLPVLVAAEDADGWAPVEAATSCEALAALLADLAGAARGGTEPEELLARTLARTPESGHAAWRAWLRA